MTSLRTTLIVGFAFQSVLVEALIVVVGGILLLVPSFYARSSFPIAIPSPAG